MKKTSSTTLCIAFVVNLVALGIIGVKLLDGNYEFTVEAYISAICFFIIFICNLVRAFGNKCPHCGRIIKDNGDYCSYCGKKIKEC